jgi:hypothetical protein
MSATENYQQFQIIGFDADAATTKNLGAKFATGREIANASAAGSRSPGVVADTTSAAGDEVGLIVGPCLKAVTSGAAFSDLADLAVDSGGKYQTATAGQIVVAIAMAAAGGADESVLVLLLAPGQYRVASADYGALTHAVGTADGTVADVGGAFNQATLNDNFKELTTKLASIRSILQAHGLML